MNTDQSPTPIGDKYIIRAVHSAVPVQRRCSGIPAESQAPGDQVRRRSGERIPEVSLCAHLFHHLNAFIDNVAGYCQVVGMVADLDAGDRQSPFVFPGSVQAHVTIIGWQPVAEDLELEITGFGLSDALELAGFEYAQQLDLYSIANLTNFVEKECFCGFAQLKPPFVIHCPIERAFAVSEQF